MHPYLLNKEYKSNNIDNAYEYYKDCLSIPIYFDLDYSKQKYIINTFKEILE